MCLLLSQGIAIQIDTNIRWLRTCLLQAGYEFTKTRNANDTKCENRPQGISIKIREYEGYQSGLNS